MSIAENDQAPSFELPASGGRSVSLAAMKGKPFVLYFYPKADTPGCTIQGKSFTASKAEFDALGVPREQSRQRFDETLDILNGVELAVWAGQSIALIAPSPRSTRGRSHVLATVG